MEQITKVAVVGLGLIGGSILKGLRQKQDYHLLAVSRSQSNLEVAKGVGVAHDYSTDMADVKGYDLVFVCAPIGKTVDAIEQLAKYVDENTIVTDVAGIKKSIVDKVEQVCPMLNFIGSHPMAGTEHKGVENALSDMFVDAKWVITPSIRSRREYIDKLAKVITDLGAKPIIADAQNHDTAAALISHFPLFAAQALFGAIDSYPDENVRELALKLAASGFRDTTRLAATNPELAVDMEMLNKTNVAVAVNAYKEYFSKFLKVFQEDEQKFAEIISELAEKRAKMYSKDGKNTLL